eukprot:2202746-Amphidinium_carterae.1
MALKDATEVAKGSASYHKNANERAAELLLLMLGRARHTSAAARLHVADVGPGMLPIRQLLKHEHKHHTTQHKRKHKQQRAHQLHSERRNRA